MMRAMSGQLRQRMTAMAQAMGAHWRPVKLLLALSVALLLVPLAQPFAFAATGPGPKPLPPGPPAKASDVSGNVPPLDLSKVHLPGPARPVSTSNTPPPPPQATPIGKPIVLPLTPGTATTATSADGQFDLSAPIGAVTQADIQAAGETSHLQLVLTQVAAPSGSTTNTRFTLGNWVVQVQDTKGKEITTGAGLHQPVQFRYHLPKTGLPIDPSRFQLDITNSIPSNFSSAHKDKPHIATTTYDPTSKTMCAALTLGAATAGASWTAGAPVTVFGQQDMTQVDLATGGLSYEVPLDIPDGPGGLSPGLHLVPIRIIRWHAR